MEIIDVLLEIKDELKKANTYLGVMAKALEPSSPQQDPIKSVMDVLLQSDQIKNNPAATDTVRKMFSALGVKVSSEDEKL